ncbi:Rv3654c family TadE-like protein [Gordonia sp. CPCC 205333]|uniref:Rv3654c family TadE-like protein n=1 Tax=Gordonia sp. CPCC 205333 TaxID=3140790 RepID=UPI003AF3B1FD
MPVRRLADDDGSATVLGAWAIGAFTIVVVLLLYVGATIVGRHRAQSAADLAALGGAVSQVSGEDACDRVADVVRRQRIDARVGRCDVIGDDVLVTVVVDIALGRWGSREASASARAGPVD